MKKNTFSKFRTALNLIAAAGICAAFVGCTITRHPDGTWTATEAKDDSKNGHYTQVDIGGKCYLSNGTWCIPCGGGSLRSCAEIRDILTEPKPWNPGGGGTPTTKPGGSQGSVERGPGGAQAQKAFAAETQPFGHSMGFRYVGPGVQDPSDEMVTSFKEMTEGMNWEMIPYAYNMFGWEDRQPHDTDFSLNFYDSDSGTVDITYLSEFNSYTPTPGVWADPQGRQFVVEILYAGGDPNDNIPDPIGVRLRGHQDSVSTIIKGTMGEFAGSVATEFGDVSGTLVRDASGIGTVSVYLQGALVYQR